MLEKLSQIAMKLRADESGVTLVEYGIAIALAIGIGAAGFTLLASEIGESMTAVGSQMPD